MHGAFLIESSKLGIDEIFQCNCTKVISNLLVRAHCILAYDYTVFYSVGSFEKLANMEMFLLLFMGFLGWLYGACLLCWRPCGLVGIIDASRSA